MPFGGDNAGPRRERAPKLTTRSSALRIVPLERATGHLGARIACPMRQRMPGRLRRIATEEARPMRTTGLGPMRRRGFVLLVAGLLAYRSSRHRCWRRRHRTRLRPAPVAPAQPPSDPYADPTRAPGAEPLDEGDDPAEEIQKRDDAYITSRTAGDVPLSVQAAGRARALAMKAAKGLGKTQAADLAGHLQHGPGPRSARTRSSRSIAETTRSTRCPAASAPWRSGRATAQKILGAAQGGIWTYDEGDGRLDRPHGRSANALDRRHRHRAVERLDRLRRDRRGQPVG